MTQPINNGSTWASSRIEWMNKQASEIEPRLNYLNSLPLVGIVGGPVRSVASLVQFAAAGVFSMIAFGCQISSQKPEDKAGWKAMADASTNHMQHAILNFGRASAETTIAYSIIGNLGLLAYQCYNKFKFDKKKYSPMIQYNNTAPIDQIKRVFNRVKQGIEIIPSLIRSSISAAFCHAH